MTKTLTLLLGSLALAGCSVFGVNSDTETSSYQVVERLGEDIEIRHYPARLAAEAAPGGEAGDNASFRLLFDYISGANSAAGEIAMTTPVEVPGEASGEEIAMTTPVERAANGEAFAMRFFLPKSYDLETAPRPTDPRVRLVEIPQQTLAAIRFSGSRGEGNVEARTNELMERLAGTGWQPDAGPTAYFYDPPWTLPFMRRNEVVVPVKEAGESS
ncbi:MAG: heme-binding protein [Kiloniellales bacterium]